MLDWGRIISFYFYALLAIGFALGAITFKVLPWLWRIAKPWIHSITA